MTDLNLGALVLLRERLRKRASDPRLVLVPGLADDLQLIGEAFGTLEHGIRGVATILFRKHCGHTELKREHWELLMRLAGDDPPWRSNDAPT